MSGITNGFRQLTVGPAFVAQAVAIACTWPYGFAEQPGEKCPDARAAHPDTDDLAVRNDVDGDVPGGIRADSPRLVPQPGLTLLIHHGRP